jgi:hypothetical protein
MGAMSDIESVFDAHFSCWAIRLPPDAMQRGRGRIIQAGWAIWYRFDRDEQGEFLDYYASHRMTNDRHVRLRVSGQSESLPAIGDFRICSDDPEEDARLKAEYLAHNREVDRLLCEKGFGLTGEEPGAVLINRHLRLGETGE